MPACRRRMPAYVQYCYDCMLFRHAGDFSDSPEGVAKNTRAARTRVNAIVVSIFDNHK